MYQHAQHLASLQRERSTLLSTQSAADAFAEIAILQARSYLAACNVLALVPEKDAWFGDVVLGDDEEDDAFPHTASDVRTGFSGRRAQPSRAGLTSYIPAKIWSTQMQEIRIISLDNVRRQYRLTLAHLELLQLYPEFATSGEFWSAFPSMQPSV